MASEFMGLNDPTTGLVAFDVGTSGVTPYQTGPEIALDHKFNRLSKWEQGLFPSEMAGWSIANSKATKTVGSAGTKINQNAVFVTGVGWSITPFTTYLVTYTVSNFGGTGAFQVRLGDVSVSNVTANGTYADTITTDATLVSGNYINILAVDGGMSGSFDSISVKAILSGDTVNSYSLRGLFVEPTAARPFPIYASIGQPLASSGAGGLSWDANGRLRITRTLPSALTRTNLIAGEDIPNIDTWTIRVPTTLVYNGDGIFSASDLQGPSVDYPIGLMIMPGISVVGKSYIGTVMVRAVGDQIGKVAAIGINRALEGDPILAGASRVLTGVWETLTVGPITGVAENTGLTLTFRQYGYGATANNYQFRYPTLEETTGYPAGVPPMAIPVDIPGATGTVEIAAEVHLPGGITASGPTQELVVFGLPEVMHQGVALTDEGYVPEVQARENDFDDAEFAGGYN